MTFNRRGRRKHPSCGAVRIHRPRHGRHGRYRAAVALQLAALGAEVVVHGRDAQRGTDTVDEIMAKGGRARFVAADLADPDHVRHLAAAAGGEES